MISRNVSNSKWDKSLNYVDSFRVIFILVDNKNTEMKCEAKQSLRQVWGSTEWECKAKWSIWSAVGSTAGDWGRSPQQAGSSHSRLSSEARQPSAKRRDQACHYIKWGRFPGSQRGRSHELCKAGPTSHIGRSHAPYQAGPTHRKRAKTESAAPTHLQAASRLHWDCLKPVFLLEKISKNREKFVKYSPSSPDAFFAPGWVFACL